MNREAMGVELVAVDDITTRLPRPLTDFEMARLESLIDDAYGLIEREFQRAGRDLDAELASVPWMPGAVSEAIREMVSAAVLVGDRVGMRSVSSTTGPTSDSATYADAGSVGWGGVLLTDRLRRLLGLPVAAVPRGRFPRPLRWPEVRRGRD